MTRHIVNNALPSCSKVILLLERAEDCHAVFWEFKPKAHKYMTPTIKDTEHNDIKSSIKKETTRRKVNSICKLRLSFLQRPGHKRSLNIAEQLKTCLHSFDLISVIVFDSFPKEDIFFTGCTVFAHLCFMPS